MAHLVIDPVTRVGGQLRVEVDLDGGAVSEAWVSGTGYRGLERILEGRDARDAWLMAERICGTSGLAHAVASVRAVENALGAAAPANARLVRNLLAGTQLVVEQVSAFYLRQAWDWVDLGSALTARPEAAATLAHTLSAWPNASAAYFAEIRDRLAAVVGSDRPGPFGGATPHPAYRLASEANLVVAAHAFEALDWRRKVLAIETILGGKSPHVQTLLVGGMAISTDWGGPSRPVAGEHLWDVVRTSTSPLGSAGLAAVSRAIDDTKAFVEQVFVPDVMNTMLAYADEVAVGRGIGHYLAFGEFPADGSERAALARPRGRVMDRDLGRVIEVGPEGVAESVAHGWYADDNEPEPRHPSKGLTQPAYDGPGAPFESLAGGDRYTWLKAPRYEGDPMEVGPLARVVVGLAGRDRSTEDAVAQALSTLGLGPEALFGTVGRIVARAVDAQVVASRLGGWLSGLRDNLASGEIALADLSIWDPSGWPAEAEGFAMGESAQGAIGHWLHLRDGRIASYQVVDATTWNASPRDVQGRRGALEEALIGTRVSDPARPLELLRTIHSFDPCLSCGVH